jgi:hypothetical protein
MDTLIKRDLCPKKERDEGYMRYYPNKRDLLKTKYDIY